MEENLPDCYDGYDDEEITAEGQEGAGEWLLIAICAGLIFVFEVACWVAKPFRRLFN